MANYTVDVSTSYESETGRRYVSFSPSSATLETGDKLYFRWVAHSGGSEPTRMVVENFTTSAFDSASNLLMEDDNSIPVFRTVQAPTPQSIGLRVVSSSGGNSKTFTAHVSSGVDSTPDPFSLGPDKNNANPNTIYSANWVKILGVSAGTPITISVNSGAETSLDGVNFSTANKTGYLNDTVYTRVVAPPYGQNTAVTLTMNGVTDYWVVNSSANPQNQTKIYFGHLTGDIKLSELAQFFGVLSVVDDHRLTDYYKNNNFVPDITENSNIPASGEIALTNFRDAATSFYFSSAPDNKFMAVNTINAGTQTYYFPFDLGTHWNMGFGVGMNEGSEFKMEFVERWLTGGGGSKVANTDVTIFGTGKSTFSSSNNSFVLQVSAGQAQEKHYEGIVRLSARNIYDDSVITSVDVEYSYFFYNQ